MWLQFDDKPGTINQKFDSNYTCNKKDLFCIIVKVVQSIDTIKIQYE